MDAEVDNLTFLVNELLELSRIEAGRVNFEFQRIHPCDLMIKPYERMLLPAERAGLSMSLECSRDLPLVFADPDRIAQVFINMLHNAIKFTPPGGRISLGSWIHENMVVFMVRDTGEGIPQKDLKRIFERFYKVDRARSGAEPAELVYLQAYGRGTRLSGRRAKRKKAASLFSPSPSLPDDSQSGQKLRRNNPSTDLFLRFSKEKSLTSPGRTTVPESVALGEKPRALAYNRFTKIISEN